MKRLLLIVLTIAIAPQLFGQGLVTFANRVPATVVTHVYAPLTSNPYLSQIGNGANDTVSGTTSWAGFDLIGASGLNTQYGAATTLAALLSAPGYNQPESSLTPANPISTFRTGNAAGFIVLSTATLQNVPMDAPQATLQMVAWDNTSGLYSTWALASVAWANGTIAAGKSKAWNQNNIGGDLNPPPNLYNTAIPSQQVESFNLFRIFVIPEPNTLALAVLGGISLFLFRRSRPQ